MSRGESRGASGRGCVWMVICSVAFLHSYTLAQTTFGCSAACTANGGKCVQEENSLQYYCSCQGTGRSGVDCATTASNSSSPVSSPSTPASSTSTGTFTCNGLECANGACVQQENSEQYVCKCNSGFSGVSCKTSTNSSTPAVAPTTSPSTSSSTVPGTYTCGGTACKNGQCLQQENSDAYYCKCNAGFNGTDCSIAVASSPVASSPVTSTAATTGCKCQRGTCTPVPNSNEYFCKCPGGWTGWDCGINIGNGTSTASVQTSSGSSQHGARTLEGWKIFVIVLAAVVGSVMAASVAYLIWRQRRTPATFVKFNDDLEGQQEIEIKRSSTAS